MISDQGVLSSSIPATAAPASSSFAAPRRLQYLFYIAILIAVAVIPYGNSLRNEFVYDDFDQVLANPYIRSTHHLREIFTSSVWSFKGDFRGASNYYRPVMSLGYLLCYRLFGLQAWGFHLVNLLANVAVVLLVFLVTLKMFRSSGVALAAACIFALHPAHSEAVDWIAAVTELELALFYLLTFYFYLACARPRGKVSIPLQIVMAGSFILALLSKEQALTLPLLATVYEHFFRPDHAATTKSQKVQRYASLWLLAVVYLVVRAHYLRGFAPDQGRAGFDFFDVIIAALALVAQYSWKLLWPVQLCAYYQFPADVTPLYPWAIAGLASVAMWTTIFIALWKRNRQAAFGVFWLAALLAPVLNVHWMTSNPFTERYLYVSSVGFCWIIGWAAATGWNSLAARGSRNRIAIPIVAAVVAVGYIYRIVTRNREWHDNVSLYTATLKVSPDADYIHNDLGAVYWGRGDMANAEREWRTALRLAPTNEYALHNLGLVENEKKNYTEAAFLFLEALVIRPNYCDAHLDLGKTYAALGKLDQAEAQLRAAEAVAPLNVRAHTALSEFYLDRRRLAESEAEAQRSVEILPTTNGYWDLGLAEWMRGDRRSAETAFRGAEGITPEDARTHFMLGLLYMDWGRTADAIDAYHAGLQLDPNNADARKNLQKLETLAATAPIQGGARTGHAN